ncbi:N-glycosylation protein-domain-containing protein [Scheffersomyces coipomensis]|uniref:N-glycosylation protein-domain-containing protein n=1 Tax=Scheffersomyces coipomensis TaxID=1788519 RepID=UPI00315C5EAF
MTVLEQLRKRFTSNLESHQIDEDYTVPVRHNSSTTSINLHANNNNNGNNGNHIHRSSMGDNEIYNSQHFDPDESVPSYETSQFLHQHQYTSTNSMPQSANLSRNSSLISTDTMFHAMHYNSVPIPPSLIPSISAASTIGISSSHQPPPPPPPTQHLPPPLPSSSATIVANSRKAELKKSSLKQLGLKFLNARQHFALALSRDVSLLPPLIGLVQSWSRMIDHSEEPIDATNLELIKSLTSARVSEHFLTGLWCIVAAYLSYSVLDGLIIRWIVIYSTPAAIVRVLSMSAIIITAERYLVSTFSADGYRYGLHIWILISCCLTLTYIGQNFVTSNLELKKSNPLSEQNSPITMSSNNNALSYNQTSSSSSSSQQQQPQVQKTRARFFDFYNIVVFAVVPVGLASFITMIGLLRSLLILRIDIDQSFGSGSYF